MLAAGLYTLRRWKLESASRGLLLIALLLAPAAVLAMAVPAPLAGRLEIPAQVASVLALGFLGVLAASQHVQGVPTQPFPVPPNQCRIRLDLPRKNARDELAVGQGFHRYQTRIREW